VSSVKNTHPSAYLQDVVAFLTTVVRTALQNLPQNIKTFVYFDALDHLATSLKVWHLFPLQELTYPESLAFCQEA